MAGNSWTVNDGNGFWSFAASDDAGRARVRIDLSRRWGHRINPRLYGKFCEHLGANIYGGMEAQILENPTFGRWLFSVGEDRKYGGFQPASDAQRIQEMVLNWSKRKGLPEGEKYVEAHEDGGAMGWLRIGAAEDVTLSPDVGPHGGRAQRFEVVGGKACGVGQWTYLPLRRTRRFEVRIVARAASPVVAMMEVTAAQGAVLAKAPISLTEDWATFSGEFTLPDSADRSAAYRVGVTSTARANIVLGRVLLYPADHVNHADPEIIGMLREAKLQLLRWPGGNFVSGWDWHDSIGPVDERPTRANPAWGGLEYNLFGTAEFIAFCRAVGCEPMICVNAGSDTPESAAQWVQYCNGSVDTPFGALRGKHGHAEPFGIRYWEVGNELWGRFQVGWTTPEGMADRYVRFAKAMLAADADITLIGCGCPWWKDDLWNRAGIEKTEGLLRITADHLLSGGEVTKADTQADVFHFYMGHCRAVGEEYARIRKNMEAGGIREPRMAVTEMQIFPFYRGERPAEGEAGLRPEDLPRPATISEALYLTTHVHEAIRQGDFVEMITHSATVNHGGGLGKSMQRTFGHPVHFAHVMGSRLMNATPVAVEMKCGTFSTSRAFGGIAKMEGVPVLDAMAAVSADGGEVVVMLVHRCATAGAIEVELDVPGIAKGTAVEVCTLGGESLVARNTVEAPGCVVPVASAARVGETITVRPFSLVRLVMRV